jgi:hypothetical protein
MRSQNFPCRGPEADLGVTVRTLPRGGVVAIQIETRGSEGDTWTVVPNFPSVLGDGIHTVPVSALQREMRYLVEAASPGRVHVLFHPPRWCKPPAST